MSDAWMPGATRIRGTADGGPMKGGAPRAVWQTFGAYPRAVSAWSAAERLAQLGRASHLVWNPVQGDVVQLIPVLRAGRLLGWPEPEDLTKETPSRPSAGSRPREVARGLAGDRMAVTATGGVPGVNAEGRVCVQICVVAFSWEPFTIWPMAGLEQILDWLESWRIPARWPAGRPAPYPQGLTTCASRRHWAQGGHFGASQVPDLAAAGPGAIDVERLTGRGGRPESRPWQPEQPSGCLASGHAAERLTAAARPPDLDGCLGTDDAAGTLTRVG